jgi:hypothetical protein
MPPYNKIRVWMAVSVFAAVMAAGALIAIITVLYS